MAIAAKEVRSLARKGKKGGKWLPGDVNDYWRDVGTIDSYWEANMDLRSVIPKFDLYNKYWPIYAGRIHAPPAKFIHNEEGRRGYSLNSTISEGCIISGSTVVDSVLGPFVHIHSYSEVYKSILMEDVEVGHGSRIQNVIIDKHVVIPPETHIGFDVEEDRKKYYVSPRGIVIIPKGSKYDRPPYVLLNKPLPFKDRLLLQYSKEGTEACLHLSKLPQ